MELDPTNTFGFQGGFRFLRSIAARRLSISMVVIGTPLQEDYTGLFWEMMISALIVHSMGLTSKRV